MNEKEKDEYFNFEKPYKFLANYMKAQNIFEIGDPCYREKYRLQNGELRAASLDLNKEDRILRTLTVTKLSDKELKILHEHENNNTMRLLYSIEIKMLTKSNLRFSNKIEPEQLEYIYKFQTEHRPTHKKINNVSIPPYFILDNTFDGMLYHHEWDCNIHNNAFRFNLPRCARERNSVSSKILSL